MISFLNGATIEVNPFQLPTVAVKKGLIYSTVKHNTLTINRVITGIQVFGWKGLAEVRIFSPSGKLITKETLAEGSTIRLPYLRAGFYALKVKSGTDIKYGSYVKE